MLRTSSLPSLENNVKLWESASTATTSTVAEGSYSSLSSSGNESDNDSSGAPKHGYGVEHQGTTDIMHKELHDLVSFSCFPPACTRGMRRASMSNAEGDMRYDPRPEPIGSRRASLQFGGHISKPSFHAGSFGEKNVETSDFARVLREEKAKTKATAREAQDQDEDILSMLLARSSKTQARRRSSMPFSLNNSQDLSDALAPLTVNDTAVSNPIGGGASRAPWTMGQEDSLGLALAHDKKKGIYFGAGPSENVSRPNRRSSMPLLGGGYPTPQEPSDQYQVLQAPQVSHLSQDVYTVRFKLHTMHAVLGPSLLHRGDLPIGTYVKVEADRGVDLGIVVEKDSILLNEDNHPLTREWNDSNRYPGVFRKIVGLANQQEVSSVPAMRLEEKILLRMCRKMVLEMGLAMSVIDAEYQFDKRKIIFYYEAESRVDHRALVKRLFTKTGSRIWMQDANYMARRRSSDSPRNGSPVREYETLTPIIAPMSERAY